jgi:CRISPR-associated protein Cmr1
MTRQVASAKLPTAINYPEWYFKALTGIWTGNAEGKNERLITTGLLGSIRWWYEVLVRGLGGYACDPTSDAGNRCPGKDKGKTKKYYEKGVRCAVCELFGCTGWSRKFRFEVLDESGEPFTGPIFKDNKFTLRFVPLRPIAPEEWALLDLTLRLISGYGAIGGKTVYKPSDEQNRQGEQYHKDYGLCRLIENKNVSPATDMEVNTADGYISKLTRYLDKWRKEPSSKGFSWASLDNFWCVKGKYLARQNETLSTFNRVIGRKEEKKKAGDSRYDSWTAGNTPNPKAAKKASSKKVFSFKEPARTFGFVQKKDELDKKKLTLQGLKKSDKQWKSFEFLKGNEIRDQIVAEFFERCRK